MLWVLSAVAGCLFFGVCNVFDRQAASKTPALLPTELLFVGSLVPLAVSFIVSVLTSDGFSFVGLAFGEGLLYAISTAFYFAALSRERGDVISVVMQLQPAIALTIDAMLLGRSWSSVDVIGILLLMLSGFAIIHKARTYVSKQNHEKERSTSRRYLPFLFIGLACIGWTSGSFLLQTALIHHGMIPVLCSKMMGVASATFLISIAIDGKNFFTKFVVPSNFRALRLVAASGAFNLLGLAATQFALLATTATAVSAIAATEPLFVFLLSTVIARYRPNFSETRELEIGRLRFFFAVFLGVTGTVFIV